MIFLYQPDDWDPMAVATLTGAGVGLGAGAWMAARQGGGGAGGLPEVASHRREGGPRPGFIARPWQSEDGAPGGYVELRLDGW